VKELAMKRYLERAVFWIAVVAAVCFSVFAFVRVSARSDPAEAPGLAEAPVVLHGFVEPAGREVFVCAPVTRRVAEVYVSEGDTVSAGQPLCLLDNEIEVADRALALARIESAEKALELSRDYFERQKQLYDDDAISELAYTTARIQAELDAANLEVARAELNRVEALLDRLELKAPVSGLVYKFDVRLGEMMVAGAEGECPIILGSGGLWVRLYVESFWIDRVRMGQAYDVLDSETGELLGSGEVISKTPYVGRKSFRNDEPGERFDTGYQEVVLKLDPMRSGIPIALSVVARAR
jgi:multidrug efflux pump subunit AcrA (membrane-fusion protein)